MQGLLLRCFNLCLERSFKLAAHAEWESWLYEDGKLQCVAHCSTMRWCLAGRCSFSATLPSFSSSKAGWPWAEAADAMTELTELTRMGGDFYAAGEQLEAGEGIDARNQAGH